MSGFITSHIVTCVMCGADVDTREESEGGDPFGCEVRGVGWVCSDDCYDDALERRKTMYKPPKLTDQQLALLRDLWSLQKRGLVADSGHVDTNEAYPAVSGVVTADGLWVLRWYGGGKDE